MGQRYELTEKGRSKEAAAKFTRGQPALVYDSLYTAEAGLTAKEIADFIGDKLVTRQDPLRVVGYYLSIWKKDGFVSVKDVPDAAVVETVSVSKNDVAVVSADELGDTIETNEVRVGDPVYDDRGPEDMPTACVERKPFSNVQTLRDAVYEALENYEPKVPGRVAQVLTELWRPTTVKQAKDAMNKLVGRGELTKSDDGLYAINESR